MADQSPPPPARPAQFVPGAAPTPEQLAALPHDNQGHKMNAISWTLTALASVVLMLRQYSKYLRRKHLWWDDYILIAAWVSGATSFFAREQLLAGWDENLVCPVLTRIATPLQVCLIIETSILSAMIGLGFGSHIWDFSFVKIGQLLIYINVAGTFLSFFAFWSLF